MIAINAIKDGIEPVMNAIGTYADAIMSLVVGKEVEYTDNKGNTIKKLIEIDPDKFTEAGVRISTAFNNFLKTLADNFLNYSYGGEIVCVDDGTFSDQYAETKRGNTLADLINGLTGIKEVVDGVGVLIDIIVKATTTYGDVDLEAAADTAARPLIKFMTKLIDKFGAKE